MKLKTLFGILGLFFCMTATALATEGTIDTGDTAWMIVSTALVMMMTPAGLALFYGGMSRYKNLLNTLAMTFVSYCLASVVWMGWGYTLAFGPSKAGLVGGLSHFFLAGIGVNSVTGTIPTFVFILFQMTFAGITVALVLGSIVDRMKFSAWIVFTVLWLTFVYAPIAHWAWGGGWMGAMGALDFAGGTVVHINCRRCRTCPYAGGGETDWLWQGSHVSVQHHADESGGGPAVVRMVRVQCRERVGCRRRGRFSVPGYQHIRCHRSFGMDVYGVGREP